MRHLVPAGLSTQQSSWECSVYQYNPQVLKVKKKYAHFPYGQKSRTSEGCEENSVDSKQQGMTDLCNSIQKEYLQGKRPMVEAEEKVM